jgi:hypothetical protein
LTSSGRLRWSDATVARPVGERPTMRVASSFHAKWSPGAEIGVASSFPGAEIGVASSFPKHRPRFPRRPEAGILSVLRRPTRRRSWCGFGAELGAKENCSAKLPEITACLLVIRQLIGSVAARRAT